MGLREAERAEGCAGAPSRSPHWPGSAESADVAGTVPTRPSGDRQLCVILDLGFTASREVVAQGGTVPQRRSPGPVADVVLSIIDRTAPILPIGRW
ncbi:hypothetical protein UY3_03141 [Chelonia mydas]|uniref:Uncharacterized protein n=1 Tax=Chelonia mydas TaxID=8469 RepID=M7BNZ7_CHEMY|nr:hypothetical protein UY3_03141 [Chelonia mydas]